MGPLGRRRIECARCVAHCSRASWRWLRARPAPRKSPFRKRCCADIPPVAGEGMSGPDLALLRLEAADMPALGLGDSNALNIGDRVHILGFPGIVLTHELLNASAKMEASVTNGAISASSRTERASP